MACPAHCKRVSIVGLVHGIHSYKVSEKGIEGLGSATNLRAVLPIPAAEDQNAALRERIRKLETAAAPGIGPCRSRRRREKERAKEKSRRRSEERKKEKKKRRTRSRSSSPREEKRKDADRKEARASHDSPRRIKETRLSSS